MTCCWGVVWRTQDENNMQRKRGTCGSSPPKKKISNLTWYDEAGQNPTWTIFQYFKDDYSFLAGNCELHMEISK